jgi:hypothetical protein
MRPKNHETWRVKAESAWRTAARCAALAQEAEKEEREREYYIQMRDGWIGLVNRCQFLDLPEIIKHQQTSTKPQGQKVQEFLRNGFNRQ